MVVVGGISSASPTPAIAVCHAVAASLLLALEFADALITTLSWRVRHRATVLNCLDDGVDEVRHDPEPILIRVDSIFCHQRASVLLQLTAVGIECRPNADRRREVIRSCYRTEAWRKVLVDNMPVDLPSVSHAVVNWRGCHDQHSRMGR